MRRHGGPRSWSLPAALVGCAAALGLTALVTGDGSLGAVIDTRPGVLSLIEVAGFALAAVAVVVHRRAWAVVPLAAVVLAEALRARGPRPPLARAAGHEGPSRRP
ncbi:hypothetical protein ACIQJT_38120 [Streptomyces sp. NPDC091972]|uniref:hypothetical protein n=1 Tax=Streptomyces sp. NPDC091972 TaxID=3366007 RepID=UPI0037F69D91